MRRSSRCASSTARPSRARCSAIARLAALHAQWAPSPYLALWSRLRNFERESLWSAIEKTHTVIRARLMRGTLHLVSARDFFAYAVATQDLQRGAWNRLQVGQGVDPKAVAKLAVAFAREPRLKEQVVAHLTERLGSFGGPYKWLIWRTAERAEALGQVRDDLLFQTWFS